MLENTETCRCIKEKLFGAIIKKITMQFLTNWIFDRPDTFNGSPRGLPGVRTDCRAHPGQRAPWLRSDCGARSSECSPWLLFLRETPHFQSAPLSPSARRNWTLLRTAAWPSARRTSSLWQPLFSPNGPLDLHETNTPYVLSGVQRRRR